MKQNLSQLISLSELRKQRLLLERQELVHKIDNCKTMIEQIEKSILDHQESLDEPMKLVTEFIKPAEMQRSISTAVIARFDIVQEIDNLKSELDDLLDRQQELSARLASLDAILLHLQKKIQARQHMVENIFSLEQKTIEKKMEDNLDQIAEVQWIFNKRR